MNSAKTRCQRSSILLSMLIAASLFAATAVGQKPSLLLLVVSKGDNALVIVDPDSGKILGRATAGEGPHEVEASSDGKLAFVTNYGAKAPGSSISVIDIAARKEIRRVEIGPASMPHGLLMAGEKLYFTAQGFKLIGRYDLASNRIDWLMGTGQNRTHMMVATKDGKEFFTANIGSDTVSAIERAGDPPDWVVTQIPVGKAPEGIDISPDGKEVWAATWGDGGVSIINVATKKVTRTLHLGAKRSNRLKFTPDGKRVLVSDLREDQVFVLDAVTRKEIKRLKVGGPSAGILMAPDGSRAYAAVTPDNSLAVIDLKTLEVTARIPGIVGADGMAWAVKK